MSEISQNGIFKDFFPDGFQSKERHFSLDPLWEREYVKWLVCVRAIDPSYYERAKTRVRQNALKQEEVLAELRSIYYLSVHGCTITALEPERLDVTFRDAAENEWSAEIKCPSYEKEIIERGLSPQETRERKQSPKYLPGEILPSDFDYRDPIRKSVDKFHAGGRNLLIISDNRFMSLNMNPFFEDNLRSQLQEEDSQGKIACVSCLYVKGPSFEESDFGYFYRSAKITDLPVLADRCS